MLKLEAMELPSRGTNRSHPGAKENHLHNAFKRGYVSSQEGKHMQILKQQKTFSLLKLTACTGFTWKNGLFRRLLLLGKVYYFRGYTG